MAADTLLVEIVTPERAVFSGEVSEVILPGAVGEMGILPGHLPLLTAIAMGDLAIVENGNVRFEVANQANGAPSVAGVADHFNANPRLEDHPQSVAHHGVVVGQNHSNAHGVFSGRL